MRPELEPRLRFALARLRLFWAATLAAGLACAGLGVLAAPAAAPPGASSTPPTAAAVAAIGAACAAAVLLLDRAILAPGQVAARVPLPDGDLALRYLLVGHLALWSLAETPAILGFAQLLLGGPLRTHLALCALALGALALLAPTRARIAARVEAAIRSPAPLGRP
jgi:hypothetical protein